LRQRMEEIDSKAERARATEAEQSAMTVRPCKGPLAEAKQVRESGRGPATAAAAEQEKQAGVAEAERIRKEREEELNRLQEPLQKIAETRAPPWGSL
jgi:hypothetical protein